MGKPSDAQEKLLQVAFDLIWNNSYGAVSVDQICERARVNKGSFYHFFPSKADLAVAAYEEHWREKQPELDRIFSPQVSPLERLERWCQYIYDRQKQKAEKYGHVCGCPYASIGVELATQDEKIRAKAEELVERNIRYVESALTEAQRQGLVSIDDPKVAAERVYAVALGMVLHAKVRNDLGPLRQLQPTIMDLIGAKAVAA
ncbi:MAG: TetR/AcrR family transcriptional regulator [Verrucomicrobia bacterium]|nr:MAG: TetR/AcrR family transcriptional regulator [Verrucomicrobiota bacterium]